MIDDQLALVVMLCYLSQPCLSFEALLDAQYLSVIVVLTYMSAPFT